MVTFSIKQRDDKGQWIKQPLSLFSGKTLKQVLLEMDGKEVVAEFSFDGKLCYFCGTEQWLERMKRKAPGRVVWNGRSQVERHPTGSAR